MFLILKNITSEYYYRRANNIYSEQCGQSSFNQYAYIKGYCKYLGYLKKGIACLPCVIDFEKDKYFKDLCVISYYSALVKMLRKNLPEASMNELKPFMVDKEQMVQDLSEIKARTILSTLQDECQLLINSILASKWHREIAF